MTKSYELPELIDNPLGEPSQLPMDTVNTQQADAVIDPTLDQMLPNQTSFHGQDAIKSAQSPLGHCASKD
jgi:hypothetical protein